MEYPVYTTSLENDNWFTVSVPIYVGNLISYGLSSDCVSSR